MVAKRDTAMLMGDDMIKDEAKSSFSPMLALSEPFKETMPGTQVNMQKQENGKSALSSVVDAYDPLLVQINTARLTHANTVSLIINNTAQAYSQRVSEKFIDALRQMEQTSPLQLPLDVLDQPIRDMTTLFDFGSVEAIGMMKGITDGVLRVLNQLVSINPDFDWNIGELRLEEKLLKPWAMIVKKITTDLQKACTGFLSSPSLQQYLDVNKYNNGELVPWLAGKAEEMVRTPDEQEAFKLNTEKWLQDQQRAIDMHLMQLQYATQQRPLNMTMKRPFNTLQGFYMPEPKKKKNYSQRYYTAKNKQRNPNPRRICKSIWQDDGVNKGCGQNSHPKGVCACWKARGFQKKDLRNGRILAWLQMAYPGKVFDM